MSHLEQLKKHLPQGIDAALVQSSVNRRYYTAFPSSAGTLLVFPETSYFIIDTRYHEMAQSVIADCEIILQDKLFPQIQEILQKHGATRLGIEADQMTVAQCKTLGEKLPGVELITDDSLSVVINRQREIKSKDEIAYMQKAQDYTDDTFTHILNVIKPGMTEREVALEMEFYGRKKGAEAVAFAFIVAAGANSSKPHAVPSDYVIKTGDFLTMDFGFVYNGYHSDMTRTIGIGNLSEEQQEVYALVLKAHVDSMAAVRPEVPCMDIDKIARDLIDSTQYKGLFGHGLGHAVGLEIHENPRFAAGIEAKTEVGHVMTIEPGVYIPGRFGVRIEDTIEITADGYRSFASSKKQLITL